MSNYNTGLTGEQVYQRLRTGNPNLLDNPWFTVNQRGSGLSLSPTPNNQYIVDRWKLGYVNTAGTYQVTTNGLSITPNSQNYYTTLTQFIDTDRAQNLDGRELTFSIKLSDGTIKTGSITRIKETNQIFISDSQFIVYFTDTESIMIRILSSCILRAVKLELGSISTLANDVAPNYGMELLKCQRYFVRLKYITSYTPIASGLVVDADVVRFVIPLPTTLRALPSITVTGTIRYAIDGTQAIVSAFRADSITQNMLCVSIAGTGFTEFKSASLLVLYSPPVIIDISADL